MQSRNRGALWEHAEDRQFLVFGCRFVSYGAARLTDSRASVRVDALVACVAQSDDHVSGVRWWAAAKIVARLSR